MRLILEVKRYHNFFWLRKIKSCRIDACCIGCFKADKDSRVYNKTKYKKYALLDIEVEESKGILAYYLCGISAGSKYENNTHVAFIPSPGNTIRINNKQIGLVITDAKEIPFQKYRPNPPGEYTEEQRKCRNWIFANYVLDGKLEE